jgi:hypothetical protein
VGLWCPVAAADGAVVLACMFRFKLWPMCFACAIGSIKVNLALHCKLFWIHCKHCLHTLSCPRTEEKVARGYSLSLEEKETAALPPAGAT